MSKPIGTNQTETPIDKLAAIVAQLRGDEGCPWDKEQTHESLRKYLIEEAYEVIDAIDANDMDSLAEELGDVLFQVVFHAQIASESGAFTLRDVVEGLSEKLIRRHPHVFGNVTASDADEVRDVWQSVKKEERKAKQLKADPPSLMDGIPRHLPALMYAEAVGKRARRVGLDWSKATEVWEKVLEEKDELLETLTQLDKAPDEPDVRARVEEEWGDLMFALSSLARHIEIDPENAMRRAVSKFEARFRHVEQLATLQDRALEQMSPAEIDGLWNKAKDNLDRKDS